MKKAIAVCAAIVLLGSIASSSEAADLFLRPAGAEGGSSMTVVEGQSAGIEIVVRLAAGEELGFANIFLDIDDDNPIEALDFIPGLDVPPAEYTSHEQVLRARFGAFPYSPGRGISIDDYALILSTGGLVGPGTFVLERIEVFGSAVGVGRVAFEFGARPPGLFDSDNRQFTVANQQVPPDLPNFVYVGVGDGRDGETGPLTIAVEQRPPGRNPPPPPGNDNENGNSNDNGSDDPPDQEPGNNDNTSGNDNVAPRDNDNANDAPAENENVNDAGDPPVDDGGVPIDPAGEDNANGSEGSPDNANSGDGEPGNANNSPGDQPGGQDVPSTNDNTGPPTPPPARRPCGMGMLPALVSMLAGLGIVRRRSIRSIG